jgi:hypothetical protein
MEKYILMIRWFAKQKKSMDNNSLFYLINPYQTLITILTFYDNRQDPHKFKF